MNKDKEVIRIIPEPRIDAVGVVKDKNGNIKTTQTQTQNKED